MKRVVLAVVLVLGVGVSEATAAKRMLGKETATAVPVTVIYAPCPEPPNDPACVDLENRIVYVAVTGPRIRGTVEHERGHLFSYWNLDDAEQEVVRTEAGWGIWREERFADAFAACRLSSRQREKARANGMGLGPLRPRLCRLIATYQ